MDEVDIRALRRHTSAIVAAAAAGGTVTITDRGRPVAQLTPLPTSRLQQLLDTGRARPARRRIETLANPGSGLSVSAELAATRHTERD
jgi:prevent-host-death family protein